MERNIGKLAVGQKAPDFSLESTTGKRVSLADFRGKWVVLYFYPKDNTPGCTREACAFRDSNHLLQELGAVVLGVSRDSIKSHERFQEKYSLDFPLLSDPDAAVHKAYGAWGVKRMYGKEREGAVRSTFLIDPEGTVRKVWYGVKVDGHSDEVLEAIEDLKS